MGEVDAEVAVEDDVEVEEDVVEAASLSSPLSSVASSSSAPLLLKAAVKPAKLTFSFHKDTFVVLKECSNLKNSNNNVDPVQVAAGGTSRTFRPAHHLALSPIMAGSYTPSWTRW